MQKFTQHKQRKLEVPPSPQKQTTAVGYTLHHRQAGCCSCTVPAPILQHCLICASKHTLCNPCQTQPDYKRSASNDPSAVSPSQAVHRYNYLRALYTSVRAAVLCGAGAGLRCCRNGTWGPVQGVGQGWALQSALSPFLQAYNCLKAVRKSLSLTFKLVLSSTGQA